MSSFWPINGLRSILRSLEPSSLVLTSFENENEVRLFRYPQIQTFIVHLLLIATTLASQQDLTLVASWQDLFAHSVIRLMPLSTVTGYNDSTHIRNFASVTKSMGMKLLTQPLVA